MYRVTGYSRSQLTRLITEYKKNKWIGKKAILKNTFEQKYTREDILLLVNTDKAHDTLSGAITKKLFERAYLIYDDKRYERLSNISVSHIYNLRKSTAYQNQRRHFTKTKQSAVAIGERRKPNSNGQPGYLRVDTVHQGDQDKVKGVYHINAIDEVTQKVFGYTHIPQKYAGLINEFNNNYLNPYINYHQPCYFSKTKADNKGKEKKIYPFELMMTPYEKLKSLEEASQYLKPGVTFKVLENEVLKMSDLDSAQILQAERRKLFKQIFSQAT